jgi:hypothetical protein
MTTTRRVWQVVVVAGVLTLVSGCAGMTESAPLAATAGQTDQISTSAERTDLSQPRPSLPTGPGWLIGSRQSYEEFLAANKASGISDEQLRAQDTFPTDLLQEIPFTTPDNIRNEPIPAELTHGDVMDDNLVVVEYQGGDCLVPVGGEAAVRNGAVEISLFIGELDTTQVCNARLYLYRATLWVDGAKDDMSVVSAGRTVPEGVIPPFLDQLPQLVIWPDLLPAVG